MFHFGGFFDVRLRQSDFALGYRNARTWLGRWLGPRVRDAGAVLDAVDREYERLGWDTVRHGDASILSLPVKEDLQALGLAAHVLRVIEHGLRHDLTGG